MILAWASPFKNIRRFFYIAWNKAKTALQKYNTSWGGGGGRTN